MKTLYTTLVVMILCAKISAQCSVVISQFTNVSCFGSCDGSASLVTVGVSPFTYSWAPGGQTVQNPSNLCPGTHTVTMTDANSCQATATVTITEPADISIAMVITNARCNGACDGIADANVTGGTFPYSYAWNDPQMSTSDTASALCPGSYTCTVTDFNGCQKLAVATITQPALLTAVITTQNVSCHGDCDGIASAMAGGGTAPYHYAWSSGCTTATCSSLCAGGYALLVTDTNNCTYSDSAFVTEPAAIVVNATENDASCISCSDGSATCAPTGGTGSYTYMWSPGGQTTQTITGLAPGNYTVCVLDMNGCTMCDTVTVAAMSAIGENDISNQFSFYPNPVQKKIIINSDVVSSVHYRLFDVTGQMLIVGVFQSYAGSRKEIDMSDMAKGIYFVELITSEGRVVKKVVKE